MRRLAPPVVLACALVLLAACEEKAAAPPSEAEVVASLEGGKPLPPGQHTILFPWIGKQSLMCIGDAVERQVAFVDFSDEEHPAVGSVSVAADGSARGTFKVPVAKLRTGHERRDEKLKNHNWLVADEHPDLVLDCRSMTRVKPTVWRVDGTWTMKGVTRDVRFFANVRYIGEMQRVGTQVVRVKASFPLRLRDYEIVNPAVGTPAVAERWDVDVVLLGVIADPK